MHGEMFLHEEPFLEFKEMGGSLLHLQEEDAQPQGGYYCTTSTIPNTTFNICSNHLVHFLCKPTELPVYFLNLCFSLRVLHDIHPFIKSKCSLIHLGHLGTYNRHAYPGWSC